MLDPSPLMTDEGDGPEYVTVFPTDYNRTNPNGDIIPYPSESGIRLRAVVNPTDASLMFTNSADTSVNNYDVVIYSELNPGLRPDDRVVWSRDDTAMTAQGVAIPVGRGAWGVQCIADPKMADEPLYRPENEAFPEIDPAKYQ